MLVFVEGEKTENPEINRRSKARTNNKFNPHMAPGHPCSISARHTCSHEYSGNALSLPEEQQTPSFRLPLTQKMFVRYFGSYESETEMSNSRYDKSIVNMGVLC